MEQNPIQVADPMEVLLRGDLPSMRRDLPRSTVEVTRLSQFAGAPVHFKLRALTYAEVQTAAEMPEDRAAYVVAIACESPDWKAVAAQARADGKPAYPTPVDAVKDKLLPGEIADLYNAVQKLTGYLRMTIRDVKNA